MKKRLIVLLLIITGIIFVAAVACSDSGDTGDSGDGGDSGDTTGGNGSCGDGSVDEGEDCEPGDETRCWKLGHYYDTKANCSDSCEWDLSTCQERPADDTCANGQIDDREICEMGDTKSCPEINDSYIGGEAPCKQNCMGWDVSACEVSGNDTCGQIVQCVSGCSGDSDCITGCMEDGSDTGVSAYEAFSSCMTSKCSGLDDTECAQENCYDAYYACYPNEKCGNGVIDDGEECEKQDTIPCEEVSEDYRPMNEAICNSTCNGYDTYSCVGKDELTCWGLKDCVKECGDDEDCVSGCEEQAFLKAQQIYDTMMECYANNCPDESDTCVAENCQYQTDNCMTHLTCGNGNIDEDSGEVCEKTETIDCGEIKDESGDALYEAGTATAFCNNVCTEYDPMSCHKFCSCKKIKDCVDTNCGGQDTDDNDCVKECEDHGSAKGEGEYSDWRTCVESCCEQDQQGNQGPCGWESQNCIDHCSQEISCGSETNDKCDL